MASIRKLPSGRYRVRWRSPGGKEHGVTVRGSHAAHRLKRDVETESDRGIVRDPKLAREPFGDYLRKNLVYDRRLRQTTLALYWTMERRYIRPAIGDRPIGGLRPQDLREMYAKLANDGVGTATIEVVHRVVSRVLSQALGDGIIPSNPAAHAVPPRARRKPPRILEPDELAAIMDVIDPRYRLLVRFAAETGLRFGEIAALRVSRLKLNEQVPRVEVVEAVFEVVGRIDTGPTKTGANRSVEISADLARELTEHVKGKSRKAWVFTTPLGSVMSRTRFGARVWRPAVATIDPRPTFHDLRHTSAALAIRAGAHPKAIQERLGHASIRTTLDIYGHLFPNVGATLAEELGALFAGSGGGTYVAREAESAGAALSGSAGKGT